MDLDTQPLDLGCEPVDDEADVFSTWCSAGERQLASELWCAFVEDHGVASGGGDAGGFEPCRSSADDEDALCDGGAAEVGVVDAGFSSDGGVDRAAEVADVEPAEAAMEAADAWSWCLAVAGALDEVRVGDGRPDHRDHVGVAGGDDGVGFGEGEDATGHDGRGGDSPCEGDRVGQLVATGFVDGADHLVHRLVHAGGDVDEVDETALREALGDLDTVVVVEPTWELFVAGEPDADREASGDGSSDSAEDGKRETQAVLERSAVGVGSPVRER